MMGKSVLPFLLVETFERAGWVLIESPAKGTEEWGKGQRMIRVTPSANHSDRLVWVVENKLTGDQRLDAGVTKVLCDLVVSL